VETVTAYVNLTGKTPPVMAAMERGATIMVLWGDLAAMLSSADDKKSPNFLNDTAAPESLLGGAERGLVLPRRFHSDYGVSCSRHGKARQPIG